MEIDCHVLTLPGDNPAWKAQLLDDLAAAGVNQHWVPGVAGDLTAARLAGYAVGQAPWVMAMDPDDRLCLSTFRDMRDLIADDVDFIASSELLVDSALKPLPSYRQPRSYLPYSPARHAASVRYLHGVKLYRRSVLTPILAQMRGLQLGHFTDGFISLSMALDGLRRGRAPSVTDEPGRLWRQHRGQAHLDGRRAASVPAAQAFAALRKQVREWVGG